MWDSSKTFDFIAARRAELQRSIREANGEEEEMADIPDMEGADDIEMPDDDSTTPADEAPQEDSTPEAQAQPETGIFVSANQKADIAKSLLDALMAAPPQPGEIPAQFQNVDVNNADNVIQYVQKFLQVSKNVDEADENNPDSLVNQVKKIQ